MNLRFIEDPLKLMFVPAWLYYPHKIAKEGKKHEPELRILRDIVRPGCTAIDVGANRGYYSYALSKIAGVVEAFEPNPAMARFARRKLGRTVRVHEVALSNRSGTATLYIPQNRETSLHLVASLRKPDSYAQFSEQPVHVAKLDDFDFNNVGFIKIDTEGSEMEVIEGASRTITQHRPYLLVELFAGSHADPLACIDKIARAYGYEGRILVEGRLMEARAVLQARDARPKTFNVLFAPAAAP